MRWKFNLRKNFSRSTSSRTSNPKVAKGLLIMSPQKPLTIMLSPDFFFFPGMKELIVLFGFVLVVSLVSKPTPVSLHSLYSL